MSLAWEQCENEVKSEVLDYGMGYELHAVSENDSDSLEEHYNIVADYEYPSQLQIRRRTLSPQDRECFEIIRGLIGHESEGEVSKEDIISPVISHREIEDDGGSPAGERERVK